MHDAVMMGKVCHVSVDDSGVIKSFGKKKEKKSIGNNKEMCPNSTYTCQGPQGSINVRVALVCVNTAPNLELFVYMHVYVFIRLSRSVCQWNWM